MSEGCRYKDSIHSDSLWVVGSYETSRILDSYLNGLRDEGRSGGVVSGGTLVVNWDVTRFSLVESSDRKKFQ